MNSIKGPYVSGVLNGLRSVLVEMAKLQESECRTAWNNSIIKNATNACKDKNFQNCTALDADQVSSRSFRIRKIVTFLLPTFRSYSSIILPRMKSIFGYISNPFAICSGKQFG